MILGYTLDPEVKSSLASIMRSLSCMFSFSFSVYYLPFLESTENSTNSNMTKDFPEFLLDDFLVFKNKV